MVPLLRSIKEAEQVVQCSKFPPQGVRKLGSPFAMNALRNSRGQPTINSVEYLQQANQSLLTVIQIETAEALECVEEIAKMPEVDALFAGQFGLANSIGVPVDKGVDEPRLKAALQKYSLRPYMLARKLAFTAAPPM
jgi:4-hydroxy-2-oxoheptanedioate aldolase